MPTNINSKTKQQVHLDLDEFTREDAPEQYAVKMGGKVVRFLDIMEIDVYSVEQIDTPSSFEKKCVVPEDREHFNSLKLPMWKFQALLSRYMEHYKGDEVLEGN